MKPPSTLQSQLLKTREYAMIMLDLIDKILDQNALSIPMFVIITLFFESGPWRNNRLGFFVGDELQKIVRIIRFVGQQAVKRVTVYQSFSLDAIMPLSSGQNDAQRIPQRIHTNVDFGAEAATAVRPGTCSA
jgi:hypothetical protein